MKKSSLLVIIIPLVIAALLVGSVYVLRHLVSYQDQEHSIEQLTPVPIPSLSVSNGGKPVTGFGNLQSANPVSDLHQQYDAVTNDAGMSGIDAVQKQASSL